MAMSVEEWNELVQAALDNPTDSATLITTLTKARDEYANLFAESLAHEENSNKLGEENTRLKEANMELYLRIGKEAVGHPTGSGGTDKEDKPEGITMDELLNKINNGGENDGQ